MPRNLSKYTSLLEIVGVGVHIGNAMDKIKEIADHVALSNDEDGIKIYLDKFIL